MGSQLLMFSVLWYCFSFILCLVPRIVYSLVLFNVILVCNEGRLLGVLYCTVVIMIKVWFVYTEADNMQRIYVSSDNKKCKFNGH